MTSRLMTQYFVLISLNVDNLIYKKINSSPPRSSNQCFFKSYFLVGKLFFIIYIFFGGSFHNILSSLYSLLIHNYSSNISKLFITHDNEHGNPLLKSLIKVKDLMNKTVNESCFNYYLIQRFNMTKRRT